MKKLEIVFREAAKEDLEEIWHYTFSTWSLEQADRYLLTIASEIEYLAKKPTSGKSIAYLRKGYRVSKVKHHYIFYRVNLTEVEIVRILHENMDIPNRLNEA